MLRKKDHTKKLYLLNLLFTLVLGDSFNIGNVSKIKKSTWGIWSILMTKQKTKLRYLSNHLLNYAIHTNALRQKEKRFARKQKFSFSVISAVSWKSRLLDKKMTSANENVMHRIQTLAN